MYIYYKTEHDHRQRNRAFHLSIVRLGWVRLRAIAHKFRNRKCKRNRKNQPMARVR